jgi:hypothetical protein
VQSDFSAVSLILSVPEFFIRRWARDWIPQRPARPHSYNATRIITVWYLCSIPDKAGTWSQEGHRLLQFQHPVCPCPMIHQVT